MDIKQATEQIRNHPQLITRLTQSEDGQKLMQMLSKNSQDMERAAQKAQQGDIQAVAGLLKGVMANSDGRALLERLAKQMQG